MDYIRIPNLPDKPVGLVLADARINRQIEEGLLKNGVKIIKTGVHDKLYEAISCHPDIVLHHTGNNHIVFAPGADGKLLNALQAEGFVLTRGATELSPDYPGDIAYNVARVGNYAFHNMKFTDPVLKKELDQEGVEFVDVKQGYSKCSISIVDAGCIITADKGIAKAAEGKGIEVLLIEPEKGILLPWLNNGFIGGSSGLLDSKKWAITGNIQKLNSYKNIKMLLSSRNVDIVLLSEGDVIDIGTIIPLMTK